MKLELRAPVSDSFRVRALASRMEYPVGDETTLTLDVPVPSPDEDWQIGLIVGPSGSGKTRIMRAAFPDWSEAAAKVWKGSSFIDDLPEANVTATSKALASVGLSAVPSWLLPYSALSNGQQQRAALARALMAGEPFVFDEFSSLLDRVVARTTAMAFGKAIRRTDARAVLATCHYDVGEWLEPDWVLDMATGTLARGRLQRPRFDLCVHPAPRSLWPLFAPHHYMSGDLHRGARCFAGTIEDGDASALVAWMSFIAVAGYRKHWRGHRAVVLPEFQGIGIGTRFVNACFAIMADEDAGRKLSVTSSSLPLNLARAKSSHWRLVRAPSRTALDVGRLSGSKRANERLTTSWAWVR